MTCQRIGRTPMGIIGLGTTSEYSRSRRPNPPQKSTTFNGGVSSRSGIRHWSRDIAQSRAASHGDAWIRSAEATAAGDRVGGPPWVAYWPHCERHHLVLAG